MAKLREAPDLLNSARDGSPQVKKVEEAKEASEKELSELMSLLKDLLSNRLDYQKNIKKLQDAIQKLNVYVKTLTTQLSQTESRLSDYVSGPKVTVEELIGVRKDIESLRSGLNGISDQLSGINSKITSIESEGTANEQKTQDITELKNDLAKLDTELEKVKKALEFVGRSGSGLHFIDRHSRQHTVTNTADHTFSSGTANFLRADGTWSTPPSGVGTPSGTVIAETTLAGSASAAGTSDEYSRGDHGHGTPQITNYLEASPTNGETAKAPNSDWAFDHNAAASGVHGSGTATLATTSDITTHAGAANPHTVYLLKQMAENDPLLLDAALSGTGTYSGIAEAGTADVALSFGQLVYLLAGSSRWALAVGDTTVAAKNKLGICVAAATGPAATTTVLLIGKVSASVFPSLTVGAPVFVSATAGSIVVTASTAASTITRIVGYGNAASELYFKPDNTFVERA